MFHKVFFSLLLISVSAYAKNNGQFEYVVKSARGVPINQYKMTKLAPGLYEDLLSEPYSVEIKDQPLFSYYLLQYPTQNTTGFEFMGTMMGNKIIFCLKRPASTALMSMTLSNPVAIIKVAKRIDVVMSDQYCQ